MIDTNKLDVGVTVFWDESDWISAYHDDIMWCEKSGWGTVCGLGHNKFAVLVPGLYSSSPYIKTFSWCDKEVFLTEAETRGINKAKQKC